jgi:ATP-dependent DNA helicase RecG
VRGRELAAKSEETDAQLIERPFHRNYQLWFGTVLHPEEILAKIGTDGPAAAYESETLDFKRAGRDARHTLELLADAAVCFANARGGTVILGVDDKATTRAKALPGVEPSLTIDAIRKGIYERTRPNLTVSATERIEDGSRLVIITVIEGIELYANAKGLATRRLGTECLPFPPEQQVEVRRARGHLDWSAEQADAAVEDLSQAELDRARRLLAAAGRDELVALRDQPLLEALRLVNATGSVTNAAILLFGTEELIRNTVPAHGYSYQYRPSPGSEATYAARGAPSIPAAVEALLDLIERRAETRPLNLSGGIQLSLADYPTNAVREVVVNALIHRDFPRGGSVDVEHSPERLIIQSPGGLVIGVTPENILTHPSTPRHRLLAEAVSLLRLAERTGQGIDRAYREMLRLGKEPPSIRDDVLTVRATLAGGIGNDAFVRFVQDLPDSVATDVEVLITLALLRSTSSVDAPRVAQAIQRNLADAQDVLARMADQDVGLLEPTRRTLRKPFPAYRLRNEPLAALARAVTYRRRTIDQIDEKVIEHVREYGFVTNRTLQRLFDRDIYAARNMLNDLRDRGLLEKLGTARGGRGVRYGPGPKFPGAARKTDRSSRENAESVQDQLRLPDEAD